MDYFDQKLYPGYKVGNTFSVKFENKICQQYCNPYKEDINIYLFLKGLKTTQNSFGGQVSELMSWVWIWLLWTPG